MPFYLTPKQDDFDKIPEKPMYEWPLGIFIEGVRT